MHINNTCKYCYFIGYFCDNTMGIVVLDNDTTLCPPGYFCPVGKGFTLSYITYTPGLLRIAEI